MSDRNCTQACVKAGGKYVFASDNVKVYQIANQGAASVLKNAGESVSVTGNVEGDTITVSKMTMMKAISSTVRVGGSKARPRMPFRGLVKAGCARSDDTGQMDFIQTFGE